MHIGYHKDGLSGKRFEKSAEIVNAGGGRGGGGEGEEF